MPGLETLDQEALQNQVTDLESGAKVPSLPSPRDQWAMDLGHLSMGGPPTASALGFAFWGQGVR